MADYSDKFLIIGAGPCGLGIAESSQGSRDRIRSSRSRRRGRGNWFHGVYDSAHIISSRKTTEYADFPMPPDYPDFPSRRQMADYYKIYTDTFNLREQILFNTKIVMCLPRDDEKWEVELVRTACVNGRANAENSQGNLITEKRIYKGVIVANGHHWDRRFPEYEGEFSGEWLHSKDFKTAEQLSNKKSSGDRRRQFGVRHRIGSGAGRSRSASFHQARLLVSAKLFRQTERGIARHLSARFSAKICLETVPVAGRRQISRITVCRNPTTNFSNIIRPFHPRFCTI